MKTMKFKSTSKEYRHEYNLRYRREHRDEIREKRRLNREKENIKRRERMKEICKKTIEHARKMWYGYIHQKTYRIIKSLWIRPSSCSICWYEWTVIAHHPDYKKIYEVVFCCPSCHKLIHSWDITKFEVVKLCDDSNWIQIVNCKLCWTPIYKIGSTKYCNECKSKAKADSIRKRKERHLSHN